MQSGDGLASPAAVEEDDVSDDGGQTEAPGPAKRRKSPVKKG